MKKIQVLIYNCETDEILTVGDLEFPSVTIDEHQISPLDGACSVIDSLGLDACMFAAVFKNPETEIWQALEVAEKLEFEGEIPEIRWVTPEFVDCKTNGQWHRKFLKRNLPKVEVLNDNT